MTGAATSAELEGPTGVAIDGAGNLAIDDQGGLRIREVAESNETLYGQSMTKGDIYTVAGSGTEGSAIVNGTAANSAALGYPWNVAIDATGNLVIPDQGAGLQVVANSTGTYYGQGMTAGDIYTVAGGGSNYPGFGGPATSASVDPIEATVDSSGNLIYSDYGSDRIQVIANSTGTFYGQSMTAGYLYSLAGSGTYGYSGDGGAATSAQFDGPEGLAVDSSGDLIVADSGNNRIRSVMGGTSQTITFTSLAPGDAAYDGTYNVSATGGGSGNPVTFSSTTSSVCTVSGSTVNFVGVGTCSLEADQTGNATYYAGQTIQSFTVAQATQAITYTSAQPSNAVYDGPTYSVSATGGGSGNPVTFSSTTPSVCSVTGSSVSFVGVGSCTVAADQAGNADYQAAPELSQTLSVGQATPSTPSISNLPGSGTYGGGFTATVSTTGDGTTSISSSTPSVCTASGLAVSNVGVGTCTLTAHVADGTDFTAADGGPQNFPVGQATPSTPSISNLPGSGTYGGGFTATVSTTGDGTTSISSSTPSVCTASGLAVSNVGVGTCTLTAHVADGTDFTAADGGPQNFPVGQATPSTPSISNLPASGTYGGGFTATVSTTGDGTTSISSSTPSVCTASGLAVSNVGVGTCTLTAHVADGTDFTAADGGPQSISVAGFAITTSSLPSATPGVSYGAVTLQTAGAGTSTSPYTTTLKWKKVTLPTGLRLSSAGVLSGTPSSKLVGGSSSITVQATETVTTLNGRRKVKTTTTVEATIPITIIQPQPAVTSVHKTSGPSAGGTTVSIKGTSLQGASEVMFGSVDATIFTVNSDGTTITAVTPEEAAGPVDVRVTDPGGTSPTSSADVFTFTP